jgi:hypothetical protein
MTSGLASTTACTGGRANTPVKGHVREGGVVVVCGVWVVSVSEGHGSCASGVCVWGAGVQCESDEGGG